MTIAYRTASKWHDPDDLLRDFRFNDRGQLVIDIDHALAAAAHKDKSLTEGSSWRVHGRVFDVVRAEVLPGTEPDGSGATLRLWADED